MSPNFWQSLPLPFYDIFTSFAAMSSSLLCCQNLAAGSVPVLYTGSTAYQTSINSFWSGQARTNVPTCIVQPTTAEHVAAAVRMFVDKQCKFSVKGGGHTPWASAASIDGGIMIDMANLDDVKVNQDRNVVSIGPGSRWGPIYDTLGALGLGTSGGRDTVVGVAGLILGGGYSWFSTATGFVCDSMINYELVDATGTLINANATHNPDLFLGLKGGGNNFGIVTRFDKVAFEHGNMWGGIMVYPNTTVDAQISAFVDFVNNIHTDTSANYIAIHSYQQSTGQHAILNVLDDTEPIVAAPAYSQFMAMPDLIASTMRITNISDLSQELSAANTPNMRYLFLTATFVLSADMYKRALEISSAHLEAYKNIRGLSWSILFQPIPRVVSDRSVAAGGNILGVDRNAGNLMLFLIYFTWELASDDAILNQAGQTVLEEVKAAATQKGVLVPYIYLNYAGRSQDVLGGYGAANRAKMTALSEKYDPNGVFQKLMPGGFKITS